MRPDSLWPWLLVGGLALVAFGADASATGDVVVTTRYGLTWIAAPASTLGCVIGGDVPRASAVACGPMFEGTSPRFALFDAASGVSHPSAEPSRGATICIVGGRVAVVQGGEPVEGASVAIQGYPSLVEGDRPVAVQPGERTRRVALAVLSETEVALVGYSGPLDVFAAELAHGGAIAAVYLDGGRAAHLAAPARDVFRYSPSERPASWITLGRRS